jgi:hypothetical protein
MPQPFPPNANAFVRWSLVAGTILLLLIVIALAALARVTNNQVRVPVSQPVAFSHALHAGELGLDCRYCHTTVEISSSANIPPTETCMTCHSQVRAGTPQLAPVWQSWETGEPIFWNRVHKLPEYTYFDHSAHINKGIGCADCHGRIDQMEGIWKNEPLTMGWCLECHRAPENYLRPREEVFNMAYERPANQRELGLSLVQSYHIDTDKLIQCSTCHR